MHANKGMNCPDKISPFFHGNRNVSFKYIYLRNRVMSMRCLRSTEIKSTTHL